MTKKHFEAIAVAMKAARMSKLTKCSRCGKEYTRADYLTHIQLGYPCGPKARV